MDISIFTNKNEIPTETALQQALGSYYESWKAINDYVFEQYPPALAEWNFPGQKYGWSFRIKDKKRAIVYLLPREGYFMAAFVFGQKATDAIMESDLPDSIKQELANARAYAEGRGIRIDLRNTDTRVIQKLVDMKLRF